MVGSGFVAASCRFHGALHGFHGGPEWLCVWLRGGMACGSLVWVLWCMQGFHGGAMVVEIPVNQHRG